MDDFAHLSVADQQRFLALVGFDLTVHGRACLLDLQGEDLVRSLAGLNELQHKIASHIAALASDARRYPDDVLFRILEAHLIGITEPFIEGYFHFVGWKQRRFLHFLEESLDTPDLLSIGEFSGAPQPIGRVSP